MSPLPSQRSNARRAAPESGAHPPGEGILLSGSAVTPYLIPCAGPEIGVASTKAFTTQLAALSMLVIALARHHGADAERERGLVTHLVELPAIIEKTLALDRSSIAWPSASPTSVILFS